MSSDLGSLSFMKSPIPSPVLSLKFLIGRCCLTAHAKQMCLGLLISVVSPQFSRSVSINNCSETYLRIKFLSREI